MAKDFHQVVSERRSVRIFERRPVDMSALRRILETALLAPSAHNSQPVRFFVIEDNQLRKQLVGRMSEEYLRDLLTDGVNDSEAESTVARSRSLLLSAPALILAGLTMKDMWKYPDDLRNSHEYVMAVQSTAAAIQNALLAARAEGLASCWLCAPLFAKQAIVETLGLGGDIDPQAFVVLGHSSDAPDMPPRKPFDEIVVVL